MSTIARPFVAIVSQHDGESDDAFVERIERVAEIHSFSFEGDQRERMAASIVAVSGLFGPDDRGWATAVALVHAFEGRHEQAIVWHMAAEIVKG